MTGKKLHCHIQEIEFIMKDRKENVLWERQEIKYILWMTGNKIFCEWQEIKYSVNERK